MWSHSRKGMHLSRFIQETCGTALTPSRWTFFPSPNIELGRGLSLSRVLKVLRGIVAGFLSSRLVSCRAVSFQQNNLRRHLTPWSVMLSSRLLCHEQSPPQEKACLYLQRGVGAVHNYDEIAHPATSITEFLKANA